MWCPSCGAEYRPGFTRCSDCDVALVDELPAETEEESESEPKLIFAGQSLGADLVQAYSGSSIDSQMIRSVLEGSGIECTMWGTGSSYLPETGAKGSALRVMVRPTDLERATEVIEAAREGDLDMEHEGDPADLGNDEPAATDWDDDLSEDSTGGPWYSRPWGQVVIAVIALLLVVAMIATYGLE
jgi:hypothetical protein